MSKHNVFLLKQERPTPKNEHKPGDLSSHSRFAPAGIVALSERGAIERFIASAQAASGKCHGAEHLGGKRSNMPALLKEIAS